MKPRRASAIVGLIGLVMLMGRSMHELPQRYRVELDVPPVEAALWFASRYPKYFTSGETGLEAYLEGLPAHDRVFVLAMSQTLAWAWVDHELESFTASDPEGLAREATVLIRHKTLNQLEISVEDYTEKEGVQFNAYVGEPTFTAGVFARLIRGASNCEGQNHLVGLLIETALDDSMPEIEADLLSVPGHDLVRLEGPPLAQPIYVDAWSNLPAFTVDPAEYRDAPLLSELGDPPPLVVPEAASQPPMSASDYEDGIGVPVVLLPERHAPTRPVSLEIRAPKLDEASLARVKDPWKIYLYARILHVYDDPRAADLYRFLLERRCKGVPKYSKFVCDAAPVLLKRLKPAG